MRDKGDKTNLWTVVSSRGNMRIYFLCLFDLVSAHRPHSSQTTWLFDELSIYIINYPKFANFMTAFIKFYVANKTFKNSLNCGPKQT